MTAKRTPIPKVPGGKSAAAFLQSGALSDTQQQQIKQQSNAEWQRFAGAVKERLEIISGERGKKLAKLPDTATNAEIIAAYNALLTLLQQE